MENEFETSIKLLQKNKTLIIEKIEKTESLEEKDKLFKMLSSVDEEIYKNYNKIKEIKKGTTYNKLEEKQIQKKY